MYHIRVGNIEPANGIIFYYKIYLFSDLTLIQGETKFYTADQTYYLLLSDFIVSKHSIQKRQ